MSDNVIACSCKTSTNSCNYHTSEQHNKDAINSRTTLDSHNNERDAGSDFQKMLFGRVLYKVMTESDVNILVTDDLLDDKHDVSPNMATPRALQDPAVVYRGL
jgi:hypothetical protein